MTLPSNLITGRTAKLPGDWKQQASGIAHAGSQYEVGFVSLWKQLFPALPQPVREHKPIEGRRYRLDVSWPDYRLAVEIDGQVHSIKGKRRSDASKGRALIADDWRVIHYTTDELRQQPVQCVEQTAAILEKLMGQQEERP
jgi:very-short-patch-repair endonuclease